MTPEYLAKPLTPCPLPTTDGWMLRTIRDAGEYILALPQKRGRLASGLICPLAETKRVARLNLRVNFSIAIDNFIHREPQLSEKVAVNVIPK